MSLTKLGFKITKPRPYTTRIPSTNISGTLKRSMGGFNKFAVVGSKVIREALLLAEKKGIGVYRNPKSIQKRFESFINPNSNRLVRGISKSLAWLTKPSKSDSFYYSKLDDVFVGRAKQDPVNRALHEIGHSQTLKPRDDIYKAELTANQWVSDFIKKNEDPALVQRSLKDYKRDRKPALHTYKTQAVTKAMTMKRIQDMGTKGALISMSKTPFSLSEAKAAYKAYPELQVKPWG